MCNLHFPFHSNLKVLYKLSRISPRAVVTWTRLEPQGLWTIQRRDSRSEFCTDKPTDAPARRLVVWGGSSCTQASLRLYIPHCTVVTEEQMCTGGFSWCQYRFSVFDFMSLTARGGGGAAGVCGSCREETEEYTLTESTQLRVLAVTFSCSFTCTS